MAETDDGFDLFDLRVDVIIPEGGAVYCGAKPGDIPCRICTSRRRAKAARPAGEIWSPAAVFIDRRAVLAGATAASLLAPIAPARAIVPERYRDPVRQLMAMTRACVG